MAGKKIQTVEERFWSKVKKLSGEDACWIWTGHTDGDGYGQFGIDYQTLLAHRVSWMLTNGSIPKDVQILHKCDNPPCVRPSHLFSGTSQDNVNDRDSKGRQVSGEKVSNHKLTEVQVKRIREEFNQGGVCLIDLAVKYVVDSSTIGHIVHNDTWTDI